ncbi:hypothetical protein INR49_012029 [Caranx melampygus]|nr:hypothetical protein INR49_012029 [Caranx melampygus]
MWLKPKRDGPSKALTHVGSRMGLPRLAATSFIEAEMVVHPWMGVKLLKCQIYSPPVVVRQIIVRLLGLGEVECSSSTDQQQQPCSHLPLSEAYNQLPEAYKKGVDLALEKVNSHDGIQHHFLFFRSAMKSDIEAGFDVSYIYHHFYLKATKCPKGTVDSAAFLQDLPLLVILIRYKYRRRLLEGLYRCIPDVSGRE